MVLWSLWALRHHAQGAPQRRASAATPGRAAPHTLLLAPTLPRWHNLETGVTRWPGLSAGKRVDGIERFPTGLEVVGWACWSEAHALSTWFKRGDERRQGRESPPRGHVRFLLRLTQRGRKLRPRRDTITRISRKQSWWPTGSELNRALPRDGDRKCTPATQAA